MEISAGDLRFVWPSIACFAFGMLVLLGEVVMGRRSAAVSTGVTAFGLLFALAVNLMIGPEAAEPRIALAGMVAFDTFGVVMNTTVFVAALGSLLVGHDYLRRIDVAVPEYNALILRRSCGAGSTAARCHPIIDGRRCARTLARHHSRCRCLDLEEPCA